MGRCGRLAPAPYKDGMADSAQDAKDGEEKASAPDRTGRRMRREGTPDGDGRYSDRARRRACASEDGAYGCKHRKAPTTTVDCGSAGRLALPRRRDAAATSLGGYYGQPSCKRADFEIFWMLSVHSSVLAPSR